MCDDAGLVGMGRSSDKRSDERSYRSVNIDSISIVLQAVYHASRCMYDFFQLKW